MECLDELSIFKYGYEFAIAMFYQFQDTVTFAVQTGTPDNLKIETLVFTWVPQLSAYCTGIPL